MTRLSLTLATLTLSASAALAAEAPVYTGLFSNTAAGGYDVVAYFNRAQPVEGSDAIRYSYQGADWLFTSVENLEAFRNNPEKYAPAYGGYCAWAVSQGNLVKGDPQHWTIKDGRLYLNYSKSVQEAWLADTERFIQQADQQWPQILEN
ncbi:YHS domain-containing (seleno)protein [Marinobacter sp. X15-166B]|uniref:YHS domain-containing (seleno)protein n=1 Tax=Marinobacter sp. X15-166B TaxID=1897620 RepID=UPI00085BB59E|nr:YHS domain-containing (seleno)protein [Marinobacter sp. X15-166B]OEY65337.1 twin-arginine translocation pathway signal protein [Marinobacter sp. X15-166B]